MKSKTIYSILLTTLLIPVVEVHALEIGASTSVQLQGPRVEARQEARAEMKAEVKADVKSKMQEIRSEFKASRNKKLDESARVRVEGKLNKIYINLSGRIDRLAKVDAEITKRLATRTNTATALSLQASAKTALAKARVDVEAAKAASTVEVTATTSKEILRGLVKTADASVKAAGEAYKKVVKELQKLPKVEVKATTTITN